MATPSVWSSKREKEMLVRDLLLIEGRGRILRGLQRLLHLLGKFIDPHRALYETPPERQPVAMGTTSWWREENVCREGVLRPGNETKHR